MSSAANTQSNFDNSRPPPGERDAHRADKAFLLYRISISACDRLDRQDGLEITHDDLAR